MFFFWGGDNFDNGMMLENAWALWLVCGRWWLVGFVGFAGFVGRCCCCCCCCGDFELGDVAVV